MSQSGVKMNEEALKQCFSHKKGPPYRDTKRSNSAHTEALTDEQGVQTFEISRKLNK